MITTSEDGIVKTFTEPTYSMVSGIEALLIKLVRANLAEASA